jgi:peptidoglycan/xylan/chitin deacetylase (PgdA/CDA1 family)
MRRKRGERWRWRVKVLIAGALARARGRRLAAIMSRRPQRPLIIGYHRVVEDFATAAETENPAMLISRSMFERHVDWVGSHFRFVSLDDIDAQLAEGRPFEEPVAAITFDDGYRDVYEQAYPVLRRKGIPAAVFVVTDLLGGYVWQLHDRLYNVMTRAFETWENPERELFGLLNELGIASPSEMRTRVTTKNPSMLVSTLLPTLPQAAVGRMISHLEAGLGNGVGQMPLSMTWPMLTEMRRAGFTIGSHTRTHVSLPMESPDVIDEELEGSRRDLERELGEPIRQFAYPGGHFTPEVVDAAYRAGYQFAYTACPHRDRLHPQLTIERLLLWEGSSVDADGRFSADILDCQAHDLWLPARACQRIH